MVGCITLKGEGLRLTWCFAEQRIIMHNNILIAHINIFWSDWTWRSTQVQYGQMCLLFHSRESLLLLQHNQLPNVIVKWKGFQYVSCCCGVTLVWRCFSMQIHCYSTICVNFILYEKNIQNDVPNICKLKYTQIVCLLLYFVHSWING